MFSRSIPIITQLPLMQRYPLEDHPFGAARKLSSQNLDRIDADRGVIASVHRMNMSRRMVVVEHRDDDPVELG